jgi:hypothetical protein
MRLNAQGRLESPFGLRMMTDVASSGAKPAARTRQDETHIFPKATGPGLMLLLIALALGLLPSGCSNAQARCPTTPPDAIRLLEKGGFTGHLGADITFVAKSPGYCFFRYECVFGQSGRMASRLIVFSDTGYAGSYAFAFDKLTVEGDRLVITLHSGTTASIQVRDIGSELLIDGEPLTFYK